MDSALVDLFGFSDDDNNNNNTNVIKKLPPEIEEGNIEYKVYKSQLISLKQLTIVEILF